MSERIENAPPLIALRLKHKDAYDAAAMMFYLLLVYIWGLWIYPLGRDYASLSNLGAHLPWLSRRVWRWEVGFFGANPLGYHVVNLGLMYLCMLLTYRFINTTVRGLWWFGTLGASLFMANPVHSESIHNLVGSSDLLPCLLGCAVLAAYGDLAAAPSIKRWAIAGSIAVLAALAYAELAVLGVALAFYEAVAVPVALRRYGRGILFAALTLVIGLGAHYASIPTWMGFAQSFAPLYLIFYPLGFLPQTVAQFTAHPALGWLAAAAVFLLFWLIHRKVKRPILLFAFGGMLIVRLVPSSTPFEWIHMIGGGQLLLANVFFATGFIVVVFRIMDNLKWRIPMISITTMIVIVFFAMQWRSLRYWHDAGEYVQNFQGLAQKAASNNPEPIGIVPDFQYHHGAPLMLSESIAYDTPFNAAVQAIPLLKVNAEQPADRKRVWIRNWSVSGGEIELKTDDPSPLYRLFPHASALEGGEPAALKSVWGDKMPEGTVRVQQTEVGALRAKIEGAALPTRLMPGNLAGKESDGQSQANADHQ